MKDKIDIEHFPTSVSAISMLHSISENFYEKSYVMKWILQVMGLEWDDARRIIEEELPLQFFPETASWGLQYHEKKWHLPVRENLSYEERRRVIYQKRDLKISMTPYNMEEYLKNVMGAEVHVMDCHDSGECGYVPEHPNVFRAEFIAEGTLDMISVKKALNHIKQSHTTYVIADRIYDVVDNSNLENIIFGRLRIHNNIRFWHCVLFDGSWNLDGTNNLDAERRYNVIAGLKLPQGEVRGKETLNMHLLSVKNSINVEANYKLRNLHLGISIPNLVTTKGRVIIRLKTRAPLISIGNVTVITRRNEWYLDGANNLDGSRLLNSMKKEEVL